MEALGKRTVTLNDKDMKLLENIKRLKLDVSTLEVRAFTPADTKRLQLLQKQHALTCKALAHLVLKTLDNYK